MIRPTTALLLIALQSSIIMPGLAAQQTQAAAMEGSGNSIQRNVQFTAKEFVELAEAMPDDKYSYVPSGGEFKGTRTFGQQVLHVANANFELADSIVGKEPPKEMKKPQSKAELVPYLKASFDALAQAAGSITPQSANEKVVNPFGAGAAPFGGTPDRIGMMIMAIAHSRDHYGQLALYLRMNGIVPPASRAELGVNQASRYVVSRGEHQLPRGSSSNQLPHVFSV